MMMSGPSASHPFPEKIRRDLEGLSTQTAFSPDDILLARALEGDAAIAVVHPDDILTVELDPRREMRFFTYGLGCCTASLLVTRDLSGGVRATIGHFGPDATAEHANALYHEALSHLTRSSLIEAASLFLAFRTDRIPLGALSIEESCAVLEETVTNALTGGEVQVFRLGYTAAMARKRCVLVAEWPASRYEAHGVHSGALFGSRDTNT